MTSRLTLLGLTIGCRIAKNRQSRSTKLFSEVGWLNLAEMFGKLNTYNFECKPAKYIVIVLQNFFF